MARGGARRSPPPLPLSAAISAKWASRGPLLGKVSPLGSPGGRACRETPWHPGHPLAVFRLRGSLSGGQHRLYLCFWREKLTRQYAGGPFCWGKPGTVFPQVAMHAVTSPWAQTISLYQSQAGEVSSVASRGCPSSSPLPLTAFSAKWAHGGPFSLRVSPLISPGGRASRQALWGPGHPLPLMWPRGSHPGGRERLHKCFGGKN